MIKPVLWYSYHQVAPRWRGIILQPEIVVVAAIGVTSFLCGSRSPAATLRSMDAGTMILTYAAIAFGFCITGMALVLTLPSERFLKALQAHQLKPGGQSSYLDLLFVFSWTAFCHWLLVVLGIFLVFTRGGDQMLLKMGDGRVWRTFVALLFALCAYSLIQFLLTVLTLAQVGQSYSKELNKP